MRTKEFEIVESGVEEGLDLGSKIKGTMLPLWCYRGKLFHHSMLCKWMTLVANSTWVICQ